MTDPIGLRVNGVEYSINADPNTPLLYILRNDLQLFGTRFGCGLGLCGACSVMINGQKMHACDVPLWDCVGKEIVTIEGIGTPDRLHALQQAFIDEQAAQCGYCANGILVTAKALLDKTPILRSLRYERLWIGIYAAAVRIIVLLEPFKK